MSDSENIDITKNLCVPQDAFEQFQAVRGYEEEEFITLSDIVEPPKPTLDLNACLDEIQDDVCIARDLYHQRDNSTGNTSREVNMPVNHQSKYNAESDSKKGRRKKNVQDTPVNIPQPTPKKRGRKRKSLLLNTIEDIQIKMSNVPSDEIVNDNMDHSCTTTSDETVLDRLKESVSSALDTSSIRQLNRRKRQLSSHMSIELQDDYNATDDLLKPRKRGRKKKINNSNESLDLQQDQFSTLGDKSISQEKLSDEVNSIMNDVKSTDKDDSQNISSNSDLLNLSVLSNTKEQNINDKKTCKRGRPKKCVYATKNTKNVKANNPAVTSKKSRKKIVPKNKRTADKYDKIEQELLRMLSTPTEEVEQQINIKQTENKQKPMKKRGRKKKQKEEFIYDDELEKKYDDDMKKLDHIIKETVINEPVQDEADDVCLSSLKSHLGPDIDDKNESVSDNINEVVPRIDNLVEVSDIQNPSDTIEVSTKRNSKKIIMSDFEYNVDVIVTESIEENISENNLPETSNPEIESPSKRPIRRKAKKILHYDEGSDEDPFANVELSDDDELSGRRGGRCFSDDEYIPGKRKKGKTYSESESSVSETGLENSEKIISLKAGRKKGRKSDESTKKSLKRSKKQDLKQNTTPDVTSTAADTTTQIDDDLDCSIQSSDITTNENLNQKSLQALGVSPEFETFIVQKIQGTNLQIKKVTAATSNENAITPLQIPVLDLNESKKSVEMFTQTNKVTTKTVEVQTTLPFESTMKTKVPLSTDQSQKACEFLKGIVKNTSELGQLMIQKTEDFIQKKINTKNLTDTSKMDYCVQKSFLLFKLAKHNLIQMEEDLANEYEQFLKSNNMIQYIQLPKCINTSSKVSDSDSDCEIIDDPIPEQVKEKEKSKLNLKTVFLNKELSIKIAKKSAEEIPQRNKEKVNIQSGKQTVWINNSIMVKKVKPTQSFLAQDSRNKKPPDMKITIEMVKNFFDNYYKKQQMLLTCAPFISPVWLSVKQIHKCNYFITSSPHNNISTHSHILLTPPMESESSSDVINRDLKGLHSAQPISLQTLCTKVLQKYMFGTQSNSKKYFSSTNNYNLASEEEYQPKSLCRLSFNVVSNLIVNDDKQILKKTNIVQNVTTLKNLCLKSINTILLSTIVIRKFSHPAVPYVGHVSAYQNDTNAKVSNQCCHLITNDHFGLNIKTLFSSCVEVIQKTPLCIQQIDDIDLNNKKNILPSTLTLKLIAFECVKHYLYNNLLDIHADEENKEKEKKILPFTYNYSQNEYYADNGGQTMALTIKSVNTLSDDLFAKLPHAIRDESPCLEDEDSNFSHHDEYELNFTESQDDLTEGNWVSQVQLQELKSCFMPTDRPNTPVIKETTTECMITSIKIEPLEDTTENLDSAIIKTEPLEHDEQINFNPLETKMERPDIVDTEDAIPVQSSNCYDFDAFEEFAKSNKMLQTARNYDLSHDEIFSQSALRVRKQHEPDQDDGIDTSMSLLIPQNIEVAKDRLMESSSEDGNNTQKNVTKKKRKIRSKISRQKNKDVSTNKDKNPPENEVSMLTRKMQERIRQEEKTDDSSDSEMDNSLAIRRENLKKELEAKAKLLTNKEVDNQIQCNDVDSTENVSDKKLFNSEGRKGTNKRKVSKTRKKSYETNLLEVNNVTEQDTSSFVINSDAPVELLECEPSLPMLQDDVEHNLEDGVGDEYISKAELQEEHSYIDRHGWKCYPVNNNDTKLYEHTYILLEKLPESFVETYFRYQGVADKDLDDTDVDRLTNLQSLHRTISKENRVRSRTKRTLPNMQLKAKDTERESLLSSQIDDAYCTEFTPSEDEGDNVGIEISSPPLQHTTENVMAKNCLMNDVDSDSEKTTKHEIITNKSQKIKDEKQSVAEIRSRPGPKSKKRIKGIDPSTLLTADKMMNKELALLNAPVVIKKEEVEVKEISKKPCRNSIKRSLRLRAQLERIKPEEESSSEEEKQWVSTKEKLLKRLGKRQDNPSADDAKRAKLVSEFIEKRGDATDKRPISRPRKRRSSKKFLERQKQMSVLNKELFGDTSYPGRNRSHAFGKGRRNIRKVIDKKSLARSTLVANMEEFARKRRLTMQQTRLREQLGCEEGVNVLVINDEVCLEYDFEQLRPVVTIHPFFTKVMKAHQYEGVKFMWDACFESLAMVASGHEGGGCILAHCMGLGKTLQVLALLHTVLTHPGVGMKRVLVCCPLSTVLNWVDEINKWIGPVTNQIKVFELSKLKKTYERAYQLEDWYKDGGIFIIGYELFRSLTTLDPVLDDLKPKIVEKIRHALLSPGPDMVICDEGHLLKNDASVLAVAMSRVATKRRIVLTGTPMQNNLREYYCMVNFVKPSLLGTYAEFSNRFENPIMNGQHRDSQEDDIKLMKARTHILHKVLEGCLQRQEASVLYPYLPKKHEYTVFIPPTKCQWELYKHYIMKYSHEQPQNNKQQKQSVLKDFHVLQKIWTHPHVLHNFLMKARDERIKIKEEKLEDDLAQEDLAASEDVKPSQMEVWWLQYLEGGDMLESLESSNKFAVVFQLLEEFITLGDKVLIFSTSLYTLDSLEYFLKRINKWSLGQEYFRLDGSVPAEVRQKWCREFNAPHNVNTKLFLISTRAGCLGLNMTAANRVIILDTSWNPAHDIQSIFRVYRFGQKKDCYIYRLVAMGTMEQKIYERSVTKQAVSCRVVDEQQIDRHYNMAELTELYRYDEEGASVEAGLAAGVSDVALLRVAAHARLHAVREHDSLLRGSREQHLPEHERNAAWMQFQQEHANNEMQDRLMEASQGIQRILEADYAQLSASVPVKVEEQPPPTISQATSKGKKTRKKAPTNSSPLLEDTSEQKDVQLDLEKEEVKVKKIMQLLIKHNFHTSKHSHEITQLVSNVRSIVDAGGAGLEHCDELTRSIASVMLQEEEEDVIVPSSEPPPLTDIITGELITDRVETKLEIPIKTLHKTSHSVPNDVPNKIANEISSDTTLFNTSNGGLTHASVKDTERRLRRRPQKYLSEDILAPEVKITTRAQLRKLISDAEQSSMDDETPLQNLKYISDSTEKKSKRLMGKPCRTYTSDLDNSLMDHSSKEQSPESAEDTMEQSRKSRRISKKTSVTPELRVNPVDDDGTLRIDFIVPEVKEEETEKNQEIKKRRRDIAVKSTSKVSLQELNVNRKVKRKAALVAEQHLEKLDDTDVVTVDDDDDEWVDDNDKKYGRNSSTSKLTTSPRTLDMSKKDTSKNTTSIGKKSTVKGISTSRKEKSSSILLSDDENLTKSSTPTDNIANDPENVESDEIVPLHPSMLSNSNFIKIVAYAYQSNRMLDEDAAMLAARYSTQKALKEYETTGKYITSGPLYDIATKVLGVGVLKKLHDKKGLKNKETAINNNDCDSTTSMKTANVQATPEQLTLANKRKPPEIAKPATPTTYKPHPKVVPIGMFKGGAMKQKSQEVVEESILPDDDDSDDDVILGTTNEPLLQTHNTYKSPNLLEFLLTSAKANPRESMESEIFSPTETIIPEIQHEPVMMLEPQRNNVASSVPNVEPFVTITERSKHVKPNTSTYRVSNNNFPSASAAPQIERPNLTLTISEGKVVQPHLASKVVNKAPSASHVAQTSSDTICLDSDEEDLVPVNNVALNGHHLVVPFTKQGMSNSSSTPTPVAVTTSMPNLPLISSVQGPIMVRINNLQPQGTSIISSEAQSNQAQKIYLVSATNVSDKLHHPKDMKATKPNKVAAPMIQLPKVVPKSNANVPCAGTQSNRRTIVRPEDVINNMAKDKQVKKVCKPGDIVRITKLGDFEVLSRIDKPPDNNSTKPTDIKVAGSKPQKNVTDKPKATTWTPSNRAPASGNDPLSILNDVIHIQADDYEEHTSKTKLNPEKTIKSNNHNETNKQQSSKSTPSKIEKRETGYQVFSYTSKSQFGSSSTTPSIKKSGIEQFQCKNNDAIVPNNKKELSDKQQVSKSTAATIDLTNIVVNKKTIGILKKPVEKLTPKNSVIVGSSKDIILQKKTAGHTLTKASTSGANVLLKTATSKLEGTSPAGDIKKRSLPWQTPNSPKKKKIGHLRTTQTLEDFDIDELDDIIELE